MESTEDLVHILLINQQEKTNIHNNQSQDNTLSTGSDDELLDDKKNPFSIMVKIVTPKVTVDANDDVVEVEC